jgi:hypothetical protein
VETLTHTQRLVRVVATLLAATLLLMGTAWGSDDHFPFGPFSMFAGINRPDDDAPDTRVEGVDATGRPVPLTEQTTGLRRAEIEGHQQRYVADPAQLRRIAEAYRQRNPGAPPVVEVRLIVRWHEIRDSRPTGKHRDEIIAVWRSP